jgi:quercetin dioxygenase-like cupin family protein
MARVLPRARGGSVRYDIQSLVAEHAGGSDRYREFLRVPDLSVGLYRLHRGAEDRQRPHAEDELYYALEGRARFRVGSEDHEVRPGTLLFVPARQAHFFHAIEDDLTLLVIFGPAEGSRETPEP